MGKSKVSIDNRRVMYKFFQYCRPFPVLKERLLVVGQEVCLENAIELIQEMPDVTFTNMTYKEFWNVMEIKQKVWFKNQLNIYLKRLL